MKRIAVVVSRILDPILIIPVILALSTGLALFNGERWRFLIMLMLVDVLLPGFVLLFFIKRGKVLSGWDVTNRQERVPLFFFVCLAHLVGVIWAWFLNKHPLAEYLSSFWTMTLSYAVITNYWKISVHAGVISTLVTFLVLTEGVRYSVLYSLLLVVIWARVYGKYHRLSQALAGAALPLILLPLCFWWFGLV